MLKILLTKHWKIEQFQMRLKNNKPKVKNKNMKKFTKYWRFNVLTIFQKVLHLHLSKVMGNFKVISKTHYSKFLIFFDFGYNSKIKRDSKKKNSNKLLSLYNNQLEGTVCMLTLELH